MATLTPASYSPGALVPESINTAAPWETRDAYAFNVKNNGAKGDGATNDSVAIQATETVSTSSAGQVLFPPGSYKATSLAATDLNGPYVGRGQVIDSAGHKRAPLFSAVKAAPSSFGNWDSPTTAFDGDLSKVQIAMEHRVTGAATLRQPASGYLDNQESSPITLYLYNESGWNQQTSGNDGRTSLASFYSKIFQNGQGDLICFNAHGFVTGAKPSATTFLANPAAVLYNGQVDAGAAGVYLNPYEVLVNSAGYDCAAVGLVFNFNRGSSTGALDAMWNGIRLQNTGSQPLDVGYMIVNQGSGDGTRVGLDLSAAGLATTGTWVNAAITLKANQRIYFDATGTDAGSSIYRRPSGTGTTWIEHNSGLTGINFVVGNTSVLQLQAALITAVQDLSLAAGKVYQINNTKVVGPRITGWNAPTGTLTRGTFDAGATLAVTAQTLAALLTDLRSHGLIGT